MRRPIIICVIQNEHKPNLLALVCWSGHDGVNAVLKRAMKHKTLTLHQFNIPVSVSQYLLCGRKMKIHRFRAFIFLPTPHYSPPSFCFPTIHPLSHRISILFNIIAPLTHIFTSIWWNDVAKVRDKVAGTEMVLGSVMVRWRAGNLCVSPA